MRATAENLDFLENAHESPSYAAHALFVPLVRKALALFPVPFLTEAGAITGSGEANALGRHYFKPVAVLANSSCYSTCDMFTAGMQDHEAAQLWLEDGSTGGGGANVLSQSDFIGALPANHPFGLVPLPKGQDMRVAWRQAIRVRLHEGELLENGGAQVDVAHTLPSSPDDLALASQLTLETITDTMVAPPAP